MYILRRARLIKLKPLKRTMLLRDLGSICRASTPVDLDGETPRKRVRTRKAVTEKRPTKKAKPTDENDTEEKDTGDDSRVFDFQSEDSLLQSLKKEPAVKKSPARKSPKKLQRSQSPPKSPSLPPTSPLKSPKSRTVTTESPSESPSVSPSKASKSPSKSPTKKAASPLKSPSKTLLRPPFHKKSPVKNLNRQLQNDEDDEVVNASFDDEAPEKSPQKHNSSGRLEDYYSLSDGDDAEIMTQQIKKLKHQLRLATLSLTLMCLVC